MAAVEQHEDEQLQISERPVVQLHIEGARGLDPVDVLLENIEPGKGRITIRCFAQAWALTAYWGAMSGRTVEQFFTGCDAGYLLDNLTWGRQPVKKKDEAYFLRIIAAVQRALLQRQKAAEPA